MDDVPLMQFKSHIEGKNSDVQIYRDRIEWEQRRGVSGGKITAGVLTGGLSLAATGVRNRKASSEMIPIKNITSVTTKRDGLRFTAVRVITSGNTIDFRVGHAEARSIADLIKQLMLGTHWSQQASAGKPQPMSNASSGVPPAASLHGANSLATELSALAELRDRGVLTEEEFAAQKARLLASGGS